MYVCGFLCVFVDGWLKKGFYFQPFWTVSDCPEKFLCVKCLSRSSHQRLTKSCGLHEPA